MRGVEGLFPWVLGVSLLALIFSHSHAAAAEVSVYDLRCEYKENPLGIDVRLPRLSWKIRAGHPAMIQSAYRIRAAGTVSNLHAERKLIWDTGRVNSDRSIHIPYSGPELTSGQRVFWQVRIWDEQGRESPWSDPVYWEMGF